MMMSDNAPEATGATGQQSTVVATPAGVYGSLLEGNGFEGLTHLGADAKGIEGIRVPREQLLAVGAFLKAHESCLFDFLVSVSGVDLKTHRETVYHLHSLTTSQWLILKVDADAQERSPSLYPVWPAVDWHERESYDLMGIVYEGHPDLRRILMPTYWLGHPLRKDYVQDDPRLVWNNR
jgi:NADH/F420H2 dehydrogenase subunit C